MNDSNLFHFFAAFDIWRIVDVFGGSQNICIGHGGIDVLTFLQNILNTFHNDLSLFRYHRAQCECTENRGGDNQQRCRHHEIHNHPMLHGHPTIFVNFVAVTRNGKWELQTKIIASVQRTTLWTKNQIETHNDQPQNSPARKHPIHRTQRDYCIWCSEWCRG